MSDRRDGTMTIRIFCFFTALILIGFSGTAFSKEWLGVDETIVEKYASEHGREARAPIFNTDQGDLLLFVFLLAGATGGFLAGYCWRMLVVEKR